MIWWQAVILFNGGALLAALCIIAGAYIMFRARSGSRAGFLSDPKGDVFSIPDDAGMEFPGSAEPNIDEKNILERTNRFLKDIGGVA